MTPDQITAAAAALVQAERTGVQIGLLSVAHPAITLDEAYAIQAQVVAQKRAAGARQIGWKIGLTSRAMQQALAIDTPDSGVLLDDMLFDEWRDHPGGAASSSPGSRRRSPSSSPPRCRAPYDPGRCGGRHGPCRPEPGNPRYPHPARRSGHRPAPPHL
jgi:hypothetical protein